MESDYGWMDEGDNFSVIDEETFEKLLERDGYRCLYCNSEEGLQPAHYISRSINHVDRNSLDNLMLLCFGCHRKHHDGKLKVERIRIDYDTGMFSNGSDYAFFFKERK